MDWIKEIAGNPDKYLDGDMKEIADIIGFENLLKLICRFNRTTVYFSEKALFKLKKRYVLQKRGEDPKEIAKKINLSLRTIYHIYENGERDERTNR
jgi:hypothetical protein